MKMHRTPTKMTFPPIYVFCPAEVVFEPVAAPSTLEFEAAGSEEVAAGGEEEDVEVDVVEGESVPDPVTNLTGDALSNRTTAA